MKKIVLIALVLITAVIAGCAQPGGFDNPNVNPKDVEDFMNPYDEGDICPFECCKNEERYYDKSCTGKLECKENKCVEKEKEIEPEEEKLELKDNEVYPGVFIEILDYKEFSEVIKEPEEVYGLVGQYILDEKRDGLIYGYEKGKKLIVVEMNVENKNLNEQYRRETYNNGYSLQFYLPNDSGENYMETHAPPQNYNPKTEYYSDVPPFSKGEKKEVFISFLVPVDYTVSKIIMEQIDEYIPVNRTLEFNLKKAG